MHNKEKQATNKQTSEQKINKKKNSQKEHKMIDRHSKQLDHQFSLQCHAIENNNDLSFPQQKKKIQNQFEVYFTLYQIRVINTAKPEIKVTKLV